MLRAVVFDFNGVLVDDEPLHLALFQRVLAEEGLEMSEREYYDHFVGLDDRGCFSEVIAAAGREVSQFQLARLIARKARYYQEEVHRGGYPFFPGARELVEDVAARGWVLAVVSGALRDEVEGALEQAGLADRFKVLVTAEDVDNSKPDPEGYRRALEALNSLPPLPERLIHPHEVLAVEDTPAGLAAARAAGLRTLAVAHTTTAEELAAAEAVVPSLEGMTAADLAARLGEGT